MILQSLRHIVAAVAFLLSAHVSIGAQDIDTLKAGVVRIENSRFNEVGTGFIVKSQGEDVYIVTASHVVRGDQNPRVYLFNQAYRPSTSVLLDKEEDDSKGLALLLLRVDAQVAQNVTALTLGPTSRLGGGESVVTIGFPGTNMWTVESGHIKRLDGRNLVLSGDIRGGNSGGPVILNGQVIGIVTDATRGDASAVRSEVIEPYVNGIAREVNLKITSVVPEQVRSTFRLTLRKIQVLEDGSERSTEWDFAVNIGDRRRIHVPQRSYNERLERDVVIEKSVEVDVPKGAEISIKVIGTRIDAVDIKATGEDVLKWDELNRAPLSAETPKSPPITLETPVMVKSRPKSGNFIAHFSITKLAGSNSGTRQAASERPPVYVEVWWPVEGKKLNRGEHTIKAMVKNLRLDRYNLYVEVNGGVPITMYDSSEDYPHKEARVDISNPALTTGDTLNLNFVAKDLRGEIIVTRAMKIPLAP